MYKFISRVFFPRSHIGLRIFSIFINTSVCAHMFNFLFTFPAFFHSKLGNVCILFFYTAKRDQRFFIDPNSGIKIFPHYDMYILLFPYIFIKYAYQCHGVGACFIIVFLFCIFQFKICIFWRKNLLMFKLLTQILFFSLHLWQIFFLFIL